MASQSKALVRCFHHGGSGFLALQGLYSRKLKYRAWTLPRSQLKTDEQIKTEAKAKLAILWDFPPRRRLGRHDPQIA